MNVGSLFHYFLDIIEYMHLTIKNVLKRELNELFWLLVSKW